MVDLLTIASNILLFSLVFGMSATVEIRSVRSQLRNYKALATGIFCQFLVLPMLGFIMVKTLALSHAVGLTLLIVTSSPGGSYSNWFASLFNADLALSVSMTAISTFLSIVMLPVNLLIYTALAYNDDVVSNLEWAPLISALALVITAISAGLYCSAKSQSDSFKQMANRLGNASGLCLILFSATMTNTGNADSKIWARHWSFYVAVLVPCVGGVVLANIVAASINLKPPERMTVAIECCYQNVGIGTSLALTMFQGVELTEAMGVRKCIVYSNMTTGCTYICSPTWL
jgi:predicted Na+-dependent transporter